MATEYWYGRLQPGGESYALMMDGDAVIGVIGPLGHDAQPDDPAEFAGNFAGHEDDEWAMAEIAAGRMALRSRGGR